MKHRKQFHRYTTNQFYSPSQYNFQSLIFNNKQLKQKLSRLHSKIYHSKDLQVIANKVIYNYGNHKVNNQTLSCGKQYLKVQNNTAQTYKLDQPQFDIDKYQLLGASEKKIQTNNTQQIQIKIDEALQFHKIGILRRLLQHYNLKALKKRHYQKSAKNFGLMIQSMKCEQNAKNKSKTIQKNKDFILNRHRQITNIDQKKIGTIPQKYILVQNKKNYSQYIRQTLKYEQEEKNQEIRLCKQTQQQSTQVKKSRIAVDRPRTSRKLTQNFKEKRLKYSATTDRDNFDNRLKKYKEFLFIINYSNQIYRNLEFQNYPNIVKYFVGKGNNANLIHSVMKKRFWFAETKVESEANFIWTQIKRESIFILQQNNKNLLKSQIYSRNNKFFTNRKAVITSPTKRGAKMFQPINPILKLLNNNDYKIYNDTTKYLQNISKNDFQHRIRYIKKQLKIDLSIGCNLVHNHLPSNQLLGNKKAMFYCLREYYRLINKDIFTILPLTFHIQQGIKDQQFKKFITYFNQKKKKGKHNIWIVKPGQLTNRGNGIFCTNNIEEIKKKISTYNKSIPEKRTYIIQAYITRPLLYNKRKFDIRAYMLITLNNGVMKAYWYQQGYIRTSNQLGDPMIHLTNDAVQKYSDCYGRFQEGNKLTYKQLQRYLQSIGYKQNFYEKVYPQMRKIATDSVRASSLFLDRNKKQHNFQIFGLDFMIDDSFKVWLIQINTNPCLQLSCGILQRLIPHMVQNAFRIGLDPIFPPPSNFMPSKKYNISQNALFYNKFQLIYDELRDGQQLNNLYKNTKLLQSIGIVQEDKQQYDHQGQIIQIKE